MFLHTCFICFPHQHHTANVEPTCCQTHPFYNAKCCWEERGTEHTPAVQMQQNCTSGLQGQLNLPGAASDTDSSTVAQHNHCIQIPLLWSSIQSFSVDKMIKKYPCSGVQAASKISRQHSFEVKAAPLADETQARLQTISTSFKSLPKDLKNASFENTQHYKALLPQSVTGTTRDWLYWMCAAQTCYLQMNPSRLSTSPNQSWAFKAECWTERLKKLAFLKLTAEKTWQHLIIILSMETEKQDPALQKNMELIWAWLDFSCSCIPHSRHCVETVSSYVNAKVLHEVAQMVLCPFKWTLFIFSKESALWFVLF